MNRDNSFTRVTRSVADTARAAKAKATAVGTGLLVAGGNAMATGGGAFDSSAITAKITENVGVAVVIIGAFILGRWTLRSMGLLKG